MRGLARLAALALVASVAACSLITSWDGLTGESKDGGIASGHDAGVDGGGGSKLDGSPEGLDAGGGSDGGTEGDSSIACKVDGTYCGGHDLVGAAGSLYACESDGGARPLLTCAKTCVRRSGGTDTCQCVLGGRYCGNDQVLGDPKTLYTCNGDSPPTVFQVCTNSCSVNAGVDDTCQ